MNAACGFARLALPGAKPQAMAMKSAELRITTFSARAKFMEI